MARLPGIDRVVLSLSLVAFAVGALLFAKNIEAGRAASQRMLQLTHHPRIPLQAFDTVVVRSAIDYDWFVILGYGLILLSSATIYQRLAFSRTGRKAAAIFWSVSAAAVIADLVENVLTLRGLEHSGFRFWGTVASQIKWSALTIAVLVIPAAALVFVRWVKSYASYRRTRLKNRLRQDWWTGALNGVADQPREVTSLPVEETVWTRAFHVPGAAEKAGAMTLCLSGGGIRSACVSMGAMQVLAAETASSGGQLLDEFTYVISVSGGGYSAGARLLAMQPGSDLETTAATDQPTSLSVSDRYGPGTPEFDQLRRRSSYIADSVPTLLRALGQVARNLLASLVILFSSAVLLGWLFGYLYAVIPVNAIVPDKTPASGGLSVLHPYAPAEWAALGAVLGLALLVAAAALLIEWLSTERRFSRLQDKLNLVSRSIVLFAGASFAVTFAIPGLMWLATPIVPDGSKISVVGAVGGAAAVGTIQLLATVASIVRGRGAADGATDTSRLKKLIPPSVVQLLITIGTLAMLIVIWFLVMGIVGSWVFNSVTRDGSVIRSVPHWQAYLAGVLAVTLFLFFCDVTSLSLHTFYRARLARTFAARRLGGVAVAYPWDEPT